MSVEQTLAGDGKRTQQTTQKASSEPTKLSDYFNDAMLMRSAFYCLIGFVGVTLALDYREMLTKDAFEKPVVTPRRANPVLPAFKPATQVEGEEPEQTIAPAITTSSEVLNSPMTIELGSGGVLRMTGFIDVGTAEVFNKEIEGIDEYVKLIELNSPGGSVFDALAISSKIRDFGWTTKVSNGNLCASSCPLIFAGGKKRIAEENAAIGVHQFFSFNEDTRSPSEAISGTQSTTARITRHLDTMEVDPQLWVHALETPPQQLYYFSQEELKDYKLATGTK